jgi:ABC-type nitrate/sulfonate/bicarbonate transport system substrate-binding protein
MIANYGVDAYGLTIATGDKYLKAQPEVVRAFVRATRKAVEASVADANAANQAVARTVSEVDVARENKVLAKTAPFWSVQGKPVASFGTETAAAGSRRSRPRSASASSKPLRSSPT